MLPATATNAEALEQMDDNDVDALVVVDEEGKFAGTVRRDRVLSAMIQAVVDR
jgi:predicted transcriptional regulator